MTSQETWSCRALLLIKILLITLWDAWHLNPLILFHSALGPIKVACSNLARLHNLNLADLAGLCKVGKSSQSSNCRSGSHNQKAGIPVWSSHKAFYDNHPSYWPFSAKQYSLFNLLSSSLNLSSELIPSLSVGLRITAPWDRTFKCLEPVHTAPFSYLAKLDKAFSIMWASCESLNVLKQKVTSS